MIQEDFTANDFSALFASLDNVTIESLKARLCAGLPEGPAVDLGALLVAAKIDLVTVFKNFFCFVTDAANNLVFGTENLLRLGIY